MHMNKSCLWLSWSPGLKRNAWNEWFCTQKTATFWSYLTNPAAPPCRRLVYRRLSQTHLLWGPIDHCNRGHEEGMFYLIGNCFSWMWWHGRHSKGRYLGDGEELEDRTNDALNVCYIESPDPLSNSKFNDVDFYVETFTHVNEPVACAGSCTGSPLEFNEGNQGEKTFIKESRRKDSR